MGTILVDNINDVIKAAVSITGVLAGHRTPSWFTLRVLTFPPTAHAFHCTIRRGGGRLGLEFATTMSAPIYLDYSNVCPMDEKVREAVKDAVDKLWADPSSRHGEVCKNAIEEARGNVAKMINALPEEIIFTSGGTESNNMAIFSAIQAYHSFKTERVRLASPVFRDSLPDLENIPHIVSTGIENASVSALLNFLESKCLCQVKRVAIDFSTGKVCQFDVIDSIRPNTCLITLIRANAETGVLQPVSEVAQLLQEKNLNRNEKSLPTIRLHTDASQAIGNVSVDVNEQAVDFMTIDGDKFYGPRIGALFMRKGIPIHPMLFGGGQEKSMRPGIENTPLIVGLGKAAELVMEKLTTDKVQMEGLRNRLEMQLLEAFRENVVINSSRVARLPNISSVTFKSWRGGSALDLLAACNGFVASTAVFVHGLAEISPSPVLDASGISNEAALRTVRFSVGRDSSAADIGKVIKELREKIEGIQK